MPILERLGALFAKPAQTAPGARSARHVRRFEAAKVDRLTSAWQAADTAIDQELRNDLRLLRRRSRQMAKDNEYLTRFLKMVSANVIGQGMTLQSRPQDQTPNGPRMDNLAATAIETHWLAWAKPSECDVAGRSGLWTMMRTAATALARDGEILIRLLRGRGTYGLQLQLLDVERLHWQLNRARQGAQNAIVMGVEVDEFHRPVAYHLLRSLPTSYAGEPAGEVERVDARDIIHAFLPTDLEQTRGYPWAHAAMRRLNDLQGYREAAVIAARIGASKMGFFTSDQPDTLADGQDEHGVPYTSATPGEFGTLPPGTSFTSYDPTYPHDQFPEFVKATLRGISSALGVAYNTLANDLEGVNFSSIRSGVLEERDQWIMLQDWFIEAVIDPVFETWLQLGIAAGAITQTGRSGPVALPIAKIDKFRAHTFMPRRWAWVDPMKDVQASILAIEAGLTTATDVAAKAGVDIEDVMATKQREQQLEQQYGVKLNSAPPPAAPAAANDDQAEDQAEDPAEDDAAVTNSRTLARVWDRIERRLDEIERRQLNTQNAAPIIHNHIAAPQTELKAEIVVPEQPAPVVNVAPAEVRMDMPAPVVNVAAPTVNVAAPEVSVEAVIQPAEVQLSLPTRRTETTVVHNDLGKIVGSVAVERDA
jgi:lambda family phage portal protein